MTQLQPHTARTSSRSLFRPWFSLMALLAVLAIVVMACGFGESAANNTPITPASDATATTAAVATDTPAESTPTNALPTSTPIPPLKSQIISKPLGNVNPGTNSAITDIACPSGYLVAGGGPKSGYSNFTMMWNAPISTTTWRVEANNDGTGPINVDVQVVCLAVAGLHGQIITASLGSVNPGTHSSTVDIACPSGYLVAGGGPKSGYSNFTMMWNAPISTTTWRAEAFNDGGSPINVEAQIVCLAVSGLHSQVLTASLGSISGGANSPIVATACPSGYLMAGAGPTSSYTNFTLMWDAPISTTKWQSEANNDGSSAITVQMKMVCLKH